MASRPVRSKDGKFAGSVGAGKTRVPTAAPSTAGASTQASKSPAPADVGDWDRFRPRWPTRRETEAVLGPLLADVREQHPQAREAYWREGYTRLFRDLYRSRWLRRFSAVSAQNRLEETSPADDEQGRAWQREVFQQVKDDMAGAHLVRFDTLHPGQTIANGYGLRTVARAVEVQDSDGRPIAHHVEYTNGTGDDLRADVLLIRLPALDRASNHTRTVSRRT